MKNITKIIKEYGDKLPAVVKDSLLDVQDLKDEAQDQSVAWRKIAARVKEAKVDVERCKKEISLLQQEFSYDCHSKSVCDEGILSAVKLKLISEAWISNQEEIDKYFESTLSSLQDQITDAELPMWQLRNYEDLKKDVLAKPTRSRKKQKLLKLYAKDLSLKKDLKDFFSANGIKG